MIHELRITISIQALHFRPGLSHLQWGTDITDSTTGFAAPAAPAAAAAAAPAPAPGAAPPSLTDVVLHMQLQLLLHLYLHLLSQ